MSLLKYIEQFTYENNDLHIRPKLIRTLPWIESANHGNGGFRHRQTRIYGISLVSKSDIRL